MLEQEPTTKNNSSELEKNSKKLEKGTTKNNLGVDCISRAQTQTEIEMNASRYTIAKERGGMGQVEWSDQLIKVSDAVDIIRNMPSVTPQEPHTFKWCTDCKEYDQEKHCCHRWSKVIRDTVEELKQEQEPFKPMVEIDLDYVIKQKYIEREVLDKIRAEIEQTAKDYDKFNDYRRVRGLWIALEIIDKYKEIEEDEKP